MRHALRQGRRSGRAASERGVALATTLALMGAFIVLLTGLMSFAFATSKVVGATATEHGDERAADAALDTAVNRLLDAKSANNSGQRNTQLRSICGEIDAWTFPSADGRNVDVDCAELTGAGDDPTAPPGTAALPLITLLGSTPSNPNAGFSHTASGTLRLTGDVHSLRPPAISGSVDLDGTYRLATGDPLCTNLLQLVVRFSSLDSAECGNVSDPLASAPTGSRPPTTLNASPARSLPTTCPSGTVVTLSPGYYDATQTARLNSWTAAAGDGCDNKVFWFEPGRYFLDVGPNGPGPADDGILTFGDPTSDVILGRPVNWNPASSRTRPGNSLFPNVCDQKSDGVVLTFTATSMLQVTDSRVAHCGLASWPGYAITQLPPTSGSTANLTPVAAGVAFPYNDSSRWTGNHSGLLNSSDGQSLAFSRSGGPNDTTGFTTTVGLGGSGNPRDLLVDAKVLIVAAFGSAPVAYTAQATVVLPDGTACSARPMSAGTTEVPLAEWNCPRPLRTLGDLVGATVRVDVSYVRNGGNPSMSFDLVRIIADTAPMGPRLAVTQKRSTGLWLRGAVHIPRSDVDVRWDSGASNVTVFTQGLVANSLTSTGPTGSGGNGLLGRLGTKKGNVKQEVPTLRLTARVGGREVGRTVLTFDTDNKATAFSRMLDWRRCTSTGPCA